MESKRLMITLPLPVIEKLERLAEEKHIKKSTIITLALEEYEKKEKGESNGQK